MSIHAFLHNTIVPLFFFFFFQEIQSLRIDHVRSVLAPLTEGSTFAFNSTVVDVYCYARIFLLLTW
jgi:hypothetical protein